MNWDRLISINPDTLNEDEKDELAERVFWTQPNPDATFDNILAFLKLVQELARHKSSQVEELLVALDEAATREAAAGAQSPMNNQIEDIAASLREKEKELAAEKVENDRLTNQLLRIEREKNELSRELSAIQEESTGRLEGHLVDSPVQDRVDALIASLRQKNSHIMQLLEDIETLEDENSKLKEEVAKKKGQSLDYRQTEAELLQKIKILEVKLNESELKYNDISEKNEALELQIRELIDNKERHDKELDAFADSLNERVEEWRHLIDVRDEELILAKEEISRLNASMQWTSDPSTPENEFKKLEAKNREQEGEIARLTTELQQIKSQQVIPEKIDATYDKKIEDLCLEISELQKKLSFAEEDAMSKGEEITTLIIQIQAYERGELGMAEAMQKLKALDRTLVQKESKILELIDVCNHLEIEKEQCEEEIIWLKEKLGWSPTRELDNEKLEKRRENRTLILNSLKKEVEQQKEVILDLKLKNRSLQRFSEKMSLAPSSGFSELQEQKDDLIAENDALRKGLHEVLESIQSETLGEVKAASLEKLLRALDARHVSGWYHPAMRLQAELSAKRACENELRDQIRSLQEKVRLKNVALVECEKVNKVLESEVADATKLLPTGNTTTDDSNRALEPANHLLEARHEAELKCIALENQIQQMRIQVEKSNIIKDSREDDFDEDLIDEFRLRSKVKSLKKSLDYVRSLFLSKEDIYLRDVMKLQREKADLLSKIHSTELELLSCEQRKNVEILQKDLIAVSFKYQQALCLSVTKDNSDELIRAKCVTLEEEKIAMFEELRATKEKLYEAEACLKAHEKNLVSSDGFNQQIADMSKKLAAAEAEMIAERNRANEFEKANKLLLADQSRFKEILEISQSQSQLNEQLQNTLTEFEMKLIKTSEDREISTEALECRLEKMSLEKKQVEELLEISQEQLQSLRAWVQSRDEISTPVDVTNEELKAGKITLERKLTNLTIRNMELEDKMEEGWTEVRKNRKSYIKHLYILYKLLNRIQLSFNCNNQLITIDRAHQIYQKVQQRQTEIFSKETLLDGKIKELKIKEGELEKQLEAVNELKVSFKGDSSQLIHWHNNSMQLRLNEMKARKQFDFLTEQITRRDEELKKLEQEILLMEENSIQRDQEWNEQFGEWQRMQIELCEWMDKPIPSNTLNCVEENPEPVISLTPEKLSTPPSTPSVNLDNLFEGLQHEQKLQTLKIENAALHTTVNSLQEMLQQKESTISRYQDLLKMTREEHAEDIKKLHGELQTTKLAFAEQVKIRSEEKPFNVNQDYFREMQELDEQLAMSRTEFRKVQEEKEKWKKAAEESQLEREEISARLEAELDRCREEIQNYQLQAQQTAERTFNTTIQELQNKLAVVESGKTKIPMKMNKTTDKAREKIIEDLRKDLKQSNDECAKLREEINKIRSLTYTRIQKSKDSVSHDQLLQKLKNLEEMLKLSKAHEKKLEEVGLHRVKSAEGVARWEEKKRFQQTIEKLNAKLKEKGVALSVTSNKLETLRGLMARWQHDRRYLEEQLKKSTRENNVMGKLQQEKVILTEQIASLQEELELLKAQNQKMSPVVPLGQEIKEVEIETLQKRNIQQQSDILSLNVQIEKLKIENKTLKEKLAKSGSTTHRSQQSERMRSPSPHGKYSLAHKLQDELKYVKNQHALALERGVLLDAELQQLRHQVALYEEKNLAEIIARREQELYISQMHQEIVKLRDQLEHKVKLLDRVKVLLKKAASKEKALNDKVNSLQNLVASKENP